MEHLIQAGTFALIAFGLMQVETLVFSYIANMRVLANARAQQQMQLINAVRQQAMEDAVRVQEARERDMFRNAGPGTPPGGAH
jgi:hypothetical protein